MIKKISIIIVFLLLICGISTADNYIINDDTVYIDDSKVYLSATPHTLSNSGWVYFNLTSKVYTGNIDACWGFNTFVSKPTKAELYKPHWINTTTNHEKTFYNSTFYVYAGNDLDYGNFYNINYKYTITESIINENGTTYITSNASFDSFDTDGINYTIYWYTRHDNHYLWKDFSSSFNSVIYDHEGYDKWYYIKNIPITDNKEYTVRAWIGVPVRTEKQSGKYYFAIKPSGETISQAVNNGHFYNLDPWWNATWSNRKNITLTGNISGAQTDYQILLNITYDNDMQSDFDDLRFTNDTHELDAWLESKVDDSYALVWVEFPTTPANGMTQPYYMYYGNAGASSDWDGAATFIQYHGAASADFHDSNDVSPYNIAYMAKVKVVATDSAVAWGISSTGDMSTPTGDGAAIFPRDHSLNRIYHKAVNDGVQSYLYNSGAFTVDHWYILELVVISSSLQTAKYDNTALPNLTSNILNNAVGLAMDTHSGTIGEQEWSLVHKYAANPPTYAFGSEEYSIYIPPVPIAFTYTTGIFWINHSWNAGAGNMTDSYNVSVNDVWYNTSPIYYNDTYTAHAWQNITVWAYNSSNIGTLSLGSISQDTQIPNNPITITNTSDWTGNAGEIVYVDYDATEDLDSDVITFSCNRTDLFADFDTVTGKGNWTATANIYYVNFGVSDGYGSISNYTMTIRELSVTTISLLDELKLIMSETGVGLRGISMGNYLVYAFILIGILLIILLIQILNNCIYRG